ncbi:two-component system sensor histidine kinase ChvG [Loktanella ponticola]|uniref:histidine kinase n=2 Tax=Yoonia TaxID=2211641 RepID=A0A7W9BHL4_9RHOB|nr:sensor histidine kinase [Yoonia ponticola]MBB5720687.1 two-component system sensor histidine kinase ChvG [Yoonia ponticola]
MTATTHEIDVRDLESVRRAARAPDLVIGDDWVAPQAIGENELSERRRSRGLLTLLRSSPIARKIITINLIAVMMLIAGILYLNSSRDSLIFQRVNSLVKEAELVADVLEANLPDTGSVDLTTSAGTSMIAGLSKVTLRDRSQVMVFDTTAKFIAAAEGTGDIADTRGLNDISGDTVILDALSFVWDRMSGFLGTTVKPASTNAELVQFTSQQVAGALASGTQFHSFGAEGSTTFIVTTPLFLNGQPIGVAALASAAGEIDRLVAQEHEQVLRLFIVGIAISIGLSLVLASTIANPLADLATAAELGRDKNARKMSPTKIRIPDLTARPDEIGRLSGALRGMVEALYERIEGNEQFAADVAHEIKNPLASLRSAVGTMRVAKREDQREKMLEIIEHDVRRLDRLVSDISNASRLDSELVKEEEETFDLLHMLGNLNEFLGKEAEAKGIDYIDDLPTQPIMVQGLEGRLAQVFVNLITNAISFCEDGDAIRVWARRRENRILVVVEDTGPGIPNEAIHKVFQRFYSERPEGQFGNNSGLGLAISKQIVEAHGGVIWAENIRPTEADLTSEPLGARFVVGLPV